MPPPKPWLLPLPPNISRPRTLERLSSSRSWSEPYSDMVQNCNKAGSAGSSTFGRLRGSGRSSGRCQPPPPPPGQGCPPPAAPGLQACHRPPGWLGRAHGGRAGLAEPLASHHPLPSSRLRGCPPVTSPAESDAPMQYARAMKGGRRARPGRMSACGPGSRPLERYSGAAGVCTRSSGPRQPDLSSCTPGELARLTVPQPNATRPGSRAAGGQAQRHDAVDAAASEPGRPAGCRSSGGNNTAVTRRLRPAACRPDHCLRCRVCCWS